MFPKISVKKPYTVFVGVVLIIVLGIVSMTKMTTDLFPNMNLPYALVITAYPGASPEEVESTVTAPVEAQMATTSNIKNISSMSYNSYSIVILEYEQSANMDSVVIEMQQKLDQLKGTWNDTVGSPMIMQLDPSMLPVMVASVDVEGMDSLELSEYVDNKLVPYLESVEGVASVSTVGSVKENIQITLKEDEIEEINEEVKAAIEDKFVDAQKEIDDAKKELEDGQDTLNEKKEELAAQIADNSNQVVNGKIQAYVGESKLDTTLTDLNTSKDTLEKAISGLNQLYEGAKALDQLLAMAPIMDDATFEAVAKMSKAEAQKKRDEIDVQVAKLGTQLAAFNITLNSVDDIPAAVGELTKVLAQVNSGITAVNQGKEQVNSGKATLDDAYKALTEGQILGVMEISGAQTQILLGQMALENGQTQLDSAKESALSQADVSNILTVDMLTNLIIAQNFEMPAGYINQNETQYLVTVGDDINTVEDLEDVILIDMGLEGVDPIHLSDVADVVVVDNSADSYSRINGNPAIMLSIEKQTGYATGDVTDRLLDKFEEYEETEEGLNMAVLMNQGVYIDIIVMSVVQNMLIGALLAVIILIVFLKDYKSTFIIACSIPLSVVFAIVLMYFSNITLNMISLSGLALGIGMLVDNSIVVIENIYRIRKEGGAVKYAAVVGTDQVTGAIVASTITTVCVFLPIVFVDGLTKQLFVDLALTILYTLGASLIVALTFVPMMASVIIKDGEEKPTPLFDKIRDWYETLVTKFLKGKVLVLLLAILLLAVSIFAAYQRGFSFINMDIETDQISLSIGPREDQTLTEDELRALCDEATEIMMDIDGIETIGVMLGGGSALSLFGGDSEDASYYIILDENTKRKSSEIVDEILQKTSVLDCEVKATTSSNDYSAFFGSGLSIYVKGRDLDKIQEYAAEVAEIVENTEGTTNVQAGLDNTTPSLKIHVDKDKAMEYKMTVAQVFGLVMTKIASTTSSTSISTETKDLSVYLQSEEQSEATLADLKKMTFTYVNDEGKEEQVRLSRIATFEDTETLSVINRDAQTKYIAITADIDEDHNITKVSNEVNKKLDKLELPNGYSIEMTGEDEMIYDAMKQLGLMLALAIILIYLVMVAQFQSLLSPFIIMFTLPLAFTGGFMALFLSGQEISVIAMLGFVMLAGIIVNNGIVMVDYINQLRREGMDKKEAIARAAATRLRPILMTTLTTVISMFPMALGIGDGSAMMQPMAITMIGGLVYGTLMTLVVVPCIYDLLNSNKSMVEEDFMNEGNQEVALQFEQSNAGGEA